MAGSIPLQPVLPENSSGKTPRLTGFFDITDLFVYSEAERFSLRVEVRSSAALSMMSEEVAAFA